MNRKKRKITEYKETHLQVKLPGMSDLCGTVVLPHKPIVPGLCGGDACDNQMTAMVDPSEDADDPHDTYQFHGCRVPYLFYPVNSDRLQHRAISYFLREP